MNVSSVGEVSDCKGVPHKNIFTSFFSFIPLDSKS